MRLPAIAFVLAAVFAAACGGAVELSEDASRGKDLVSSLGCVSCHSETGTAGVGPSWSGVWGTDRQLADGSSVTFDEAYVAKSLLEPGSQVLDGYQEVMPTFSVSSAELEAIVSYLEELR